MPRLLPLASPGRRTVALASLLAAATALAEAQAPAAERPVCPPLTTCVRATSFDAYAADFRITTLAGSRTATLQVRFVNPGPKPVTLAYVDNSGVVTDDRGNRYTIVASAAVRGLGRIASGRVDAGFELGPGEAGDATLEFLWPGAFDQVRGTQYVAQFAVREVERLPSRQVRVGREHVVRFGQLTEQGAVGGAPVAAADGGDAAPSGGATRALPGTDPACTASPRCRASGPLTVDITRFVGSGAPGQGHRLQVTVRVRNGGDRPLVLGYRPGDIRGADELGQPYRRDANGEARGIGLITRDGIDPSFVLAPGESREFTLGLMRPWSRTQGLGRRYAMDFAISELRPLPSRQVEVGREYSIAFSDLALDGTGATPARGATPNAGEVLRDLFRRKRP